MPRQNFKMLADKNQKMCCCSAGVSPAIFLVSAQCKNAGETPELRKPPCVREVYELHFAAPLHREKSVLRPAAHSGKHSKNSADFGKAERRSSSEIRHSVRA